MGALKQKEDEQRTRFLLIFRKTILRIRNEAMGNPIYMIRYSLFSCPWFSIKLHRILLSDDDCLHDHPWSFISFILTGGYHEVSPMPGMEGFINRNFPHITRKRWFGPGSILWRPTPSIHRLEVSKPATSLVISFRKTRLWGFYTPTGWKIFDEYIRSGQKCE